MTGTVVFWCGLLQESESTGRQQEQKQSPKETGMCVCREGTGCGWMCIRVYVQVLRWVKASSECIVRDTEVSVGIAIISRHFVTIYGDWMAAM